MSTEKTEKVSKPGYKTTEFWLTMAAMLVSALTASGALADGSTAAQIVAVIAAALSGMGYSVARSMAKK